MLGGSLEYVDLLLSLRSMYTLKLDEFHLLSPSAGTAELRTTGERRKFAKTKKRGNSHTPNRKGMDEESPKADQSVLLQQLLSEEKANSSRLAKQLRDQTALLSSLIAQKSPKSIKSEEPQLPTDSSMSRVTRLQGKVLSAVQVITEKVIAKAQTRDEDTEKIVQSRVAYMQEEIEAERSRLRAIIAEKDKEIEGARAGCQEVKEKLEKTAMKLKQSQKALSELRTANQNLELAKQILHRQIIELKRDNKKLSEDQSHLMIRTDSPASPRLTRGLCTPSRGLHTTGASGDGMHPRFESVISKLRHMLEIERKSLRATRSALATELQRKHDVEKTVTAALSTLKTQITLEKDRENAISVLSMREVLTSQKQVLEGVLRLTFIQPPSSLRFDSPAPQRPAQLEASFDF